MDMHTELKAVPHASLRNPNPEKSRKVLRNLGVFKRNGGQSLKSTTKRQSDDGRTCLPSEVLGLASCHSEDSENGRYVVLASQNYITVRQMRLRWLETSEAHSSPLLKKKNTIRLDPCDYKGHTHTRLPKGRQN